MPMFPCINLKSLKGAIPPRMILDDKSCKAFEGESVGSSSNVVVIVGIDSWADRRHLLVDIVGILAVPQDQRRRG